MATTKSTYYQDKRQPSAIDIAEEIKAIVTTKFSILLMK